MMGGGTRMPPNCGRTYNLPSRTTTLRAQPVAVTNNQHPHHHIRNAPLASRKGGLSIRVPTPDLDCGAANGARGEVSWRLTMRPAYRRGRSNPSR
jgi:hypothetical protein